MRQEGLEAGRGSITGRVLLEGKIVHVHDVQADPTTLFQALLLPGMRSMLGVPLLREGAPIGVIVLSRSTKQPFTDKQIELVSTFADQAVIAIENVRLFDEIQKKSRQLAEASQHKSQFLANMSHELRTPLNAIIGVSEMLREDAEAAKQDVDQVLISSHRKLLLSKAMVVNVAEKSERGSHSRSPSLTARFQLGTSSRVYANRAHPCLCAIVRRYFESYPDDRIRKGCEIAPSPVHPPRSR